jgi:hypothetical protein
VKWYILNRSTLNLIDLGVDLLDANGSNATVLCDAAEPYMYVAMIDESTRERWLNEVRNNQHPDAWFSRDHDILIYVGNYPDHERAVDGARQKNEELCTQNDLADNLMPMSTVAQWLVD